MRRLSESFRRGERNALVVAILWAAIVAVGAFVAPLYRGGATLVGVNGSYTAIAAVTPLVLAVGTTVALALRGSLAGAGPLAWTLSALCALFAVVSFLSIGVFILPTAGCLIYACAMHGREPSTGFYLTFKWR
ncbi:MAG: hypothetical protein Q4P15_01330 [Propionibacteriaceae bacterium]|nr:hypothetical protein [Propionibacteriaceae bacterium]